MAIGRPSIFSQETADAICSQLVEGKSLRKICEADDMPGSRTVFKWLEDDALFRQQYARARELQADVLAEETLDIADEPASVITRGDGEETAVSVDSGFVARQRLRIDARKWYASKVAPKKYGDKLDVEHSGRNGGPIQTLSATMTPQEASDAYQKVMEG